MSQYDPGRFSPGVFLFTPRSERNNTNERQPMPEIAEVEPPQPVVKFDIQESMEKFYGLIIWGMRRSGIQERKLNIDLAHDMFCQTYSGYDGSTKLTTYVWKWLPYAIRGWQYKAWKEEKDREKHVQPTNIPVEDSNDRLDHLDYPTKERLYELLETLTERERVMIGLYYGFSEEDGYGYDFTMDDIARKFNISKGRVASILKKAIGKLQYRCSILERRSEPFSFDFLASVLTDRDNPQFDYLRTPFFVDPSFIRPPGPSNERE